MKLSYHNLSLARGFAILEQIAAHNGDITLTEIANNLGMAKATTKRFIDSLIGMGYIFPAPKGKTFSVSLKILQLGYSAICGLKWREIAKVYLDQFYAEVQETTSACTLEDMNILYVFRATRPGFVFSQPIGTLRPAYASSMGKMLLALKSESWLRSFLDRLEFSAITPHTVNSREALVRQLAEVRERGYAICDREVSEVLRSIAVPIQARGQILAAIGVAVWTQDYSLDKLISVMLPKVQACATQISTTLDQLEYDFF